MSCREVGNCGHLNKIWVSVMILSLKKLPGTLKVIRRLDFFGLLGPLQ